MAESKIPSLLPSITPDIQAAHSPHDPEKHDCHNSRPLRSLRFAQYSQREPYANDPSSSRHFLKSDLLNARIINQVDRKFIACLIRDGGSESRTELEQGSDAHNPNKGVHALILIDQHAADERVRVERFLKELCLGFLMSHDTTENGGKGVHTREMAPPVPVLLTRREALHLETSVDTQQAFRSWGFRFGFPVVPEAQNSTGSDGNSKYNGLDAANASGYAQIVVHSIPEVVADKVCQRSSEIIPCYPPTLFYFR